MSRALTPDDAELLRGILADNLVYWLRQAEGLPAAVWADVDEATRATVTRRLWLLHALTLTEGADGILRALPDPRD